MLEFVEEALMRAVADHLGIEALDMPLRAGMRTWNAQDIARLLPIFKRHVDAAHMLAKGAIPFDPPRDFLRDKSWAERYKIGIQKLVDFGVLKP